MYTFSQLVDSLVLEHQRPDMRETIAGYLNQTIRDVHAKGTAGLLQLFGENRREVIFTPPAAPAVWPIPIPAVFQHLEAVYAVERAVYLQARRPHVSLVPSRDPLARYYYYRTGGAYALSGITPNEQVRISYFEYPPYLFYYTHENRPATYDRSAGAYVVNEAWAGTDAEALALVTNWLIERYGETLKEGVRVKLYRRLAATEQATQSYATFEMQRAAIQNSEGYGE